MKRLAFAIVAAGVLAATATTSAEASGGCGPYRHRTPWGACRPPGQFGWPPGWRGGPVVVVRPGWGWHHRHYW